MAGGIINLQSFSHSLSPEAITGFGLGYSEKPPQYPEIFSVRASKRNFEKFYMVSALDLPSAIAGDGGNVSYDSMSEGWAQTFTHSKFGTGVILTKDLLDDSQDGLVVKLRTQELGRVMRLKKDYVAAAYMDAGFSDVNGGDGKALYDLAHPLMRGGTFANKISVAADAGELVLETMLIEMKQMTNEAGHKFPIAARKMLVSDQQVFEIHRLLGSKMQVYTPDNTANAIKDLGVLDERNVIFSPFLTDVDAIHILTDASVDEGLIFFNRREPEIQNDNVFDNENAKFISIMRISCGHLNPRCVFGNAGA